MRGRVLIVDDDRGMCELLRSGLSEAGYEPTVESGGEAAFEALRGSDFDVVVTDLNMRGMNGLELCGRISSNRPDVPVIVITAFGSLETAVAAIRAGAFDFITKPFELEALQITLDRAVRFRSLQEEVGRLRVEVARARSQNLLIGDSQVMRRLHEMIPPVAATDASVLIVGETGTGKELVAKAIHAGSARRDGPFVAVNCVAVPESLLESELFGHTRGAFTDARSARKGLFAQASGGTLFLDEIGDMPVTMQPKLLRVLQERRFRPVGSDEEVEFSARVIVATHRDLDALVEEGLFRQDLYFRINVLLIEVPPLRARGNDILLLAQHFLEVAGARYGKKVHGLSGQAAERLLAYSWPGNVRELENCVERAVALTLFEQIAVDDLPEKIRSYERTRLPPSSEDPSEILPLEEIERRAILRALESLGGNKTAAAQALGLDRKTLYRKLERFLGRQEGGHEARGEAREGPEQGQDQEGPEGEAPP